MAFSSLAQQLSSRKQQGYLRQRYTVEQDYDGVITVDGKHYLNFASNDYLGMKQEHDVLQAWTEGLATYGAGSGASPLVTGYSKAHWALEDYLASGLNREAVLLFNSGFAANQAICQALFASSGNIVADKLMHASFLEGAMASKASLRRFGHNSIEHLSTLLHKTDHGDTLIASEGIFSMDGDAPDFSALIATCEQHNAWLMIDDAHGLGVLGETGLGSAEHLGLSQQQVPILMGTFGKAVGTAGAFIAGSQTLIDYLVNFARHYVYSTAFPPAQAVATLKSLQLIAKNSRSEALRENVQYFRLLAKEAGFSLMPSESAIQPIVVASPNAALAMSSGLKKRGIWIPAIRYPTVPKGTDRLRITLTSLHQKKDIEHLIDALQLVKKEVVVDD